MHELDRRIWEMWPRSTFKHTRSSRTLSLELALHIITTLARDNNRKWELHSALQIIQGLQQGARLKVYSQELQPSKWTPTQKKEDESRLTSGTLRSPSLLTSGSA